MAGMGDAPEASLSLDGVTISEADIDTLSTACGLSLNLIAYLFKSFALAKAVAASGTLLVDPDTVMRMASRMPRRATANVVLDDLAIELLIALKMA